MSDDLRVPSVVRNLLERGVLLRIKYQPGQNYARLQ